MGGKVQIILAQMKGKKLGNHVIDGRQGAWLSWKPNQCGLQLKFQNSTLEISRNKM